MFANVWAFFLITDPRTIRRPLCFLLHAFVSTLDGIHFITISVIIKAEIKNYGVAIPFVIFSKSI